MTLCNECKIGTLLVRGEDSFELLPYEIITCSYCDYRAKGKDLTKSKRWKDKFG